MVDFLTADSPISDTSVIKDYIDEDLESPRKTEMRKGSDYFKAKHDILQRKITYLSDGQEIEDKSKSNHKLMHPFFRMMVLQKTGYVVGNPIVFSVEDKGTEAEKFEQRINELLGEVFDDKANMWVQGAANKGVEWLHPYIDKDGNFKYVIIPAEQIIPIYDTEYEEELQAIIRYYSMTVVDGAQKRTRYRVELWDKEKVTYFMQQADNTYALDAIDPNPRYHWYSFNTTSPSEMKANSWGRIPFIALENNDDQIPDLRFTKTLIDDYDLNASDFSNNLSDIQELIWILKGYEGTSLDEFLANIKTKKAITLEADPESGAETARAELPKDARDSHLDRLEDNIFIFGMGVNMKTDKFGNSPSGIALKFMYALLDLNANILIRKMKSSLKELMYFVTVYINMVDKTSYDHTKVKFTFNKSMITNTSEAIDNAQKSKGVISDKTILENHPWVDDAGEEEERIAEEVGRIVLDDEDGDEDVTE
ncbi:phage portal protein [Paenibacillus alkaliterrae]|uniref:phage portal protein n=1 Tax=Paenibacillus alkaliterrae TaxID=320909 RepID=UPI001F1EF572|nr:phage portal protein [Paenibacillus alkaliterrae]MCF2939034.1 phage portal protein [Paenibacillus alkaliterrae]